MPDDTAGVGWFVSDLQGVKGIVQCAVVFCLVVVQCDDVKWFFVWWIVTLVCDGLVVGNRYKVCLDSCKQGGVGYSYVDVVDDVHGGVCVVVWWEGGDEAIGACKMSVVMWEDRR